MLNDCVISICQSVDNIEPLDSIELLHQRSTIKWMESGAQIFRLERPATPDKHLVSYFVLFDKARNKIMLVDHIKAGLKVPSGGHVDDGEMPRDTVVREAEEELKIKALFDSALGDEPFFITVTKTTGADSHTDVSLWYIISHDSSQELDFDEREMTACRWYGFDEILNMDIKTMDPHMHRFVRKLQSQLMSLRLMSKGLKNES